MNEAITWSLRPTLWSSGILRIDQWSSYLSEGGIRIFYSYSIFLAISFRVIDIWYSEFSIIGLLYYAQDYQGFLYLRYSGSFLEQHWACSTAGILLRSCVIRLILFGIVRRFIQPEVQRMSISWLLFSRLESPYLLSSFEFFGGIPASIIGPQDFHLLPCLIFHQSFVASKAHHSSFDDD